MVVGWEIVDLRRRRKEVVMRIVGMETMGVKEKEQYILGFGGDFLIPIFFFFLIIHDETKLLLFNSTPRFYLNPS